MANIKLTSALAATAISFTVSISSISSAVSGETEVVASSALGTSISFSHELIPTRTIDFDLSDSDIDPDPVTVSDTIVVQFEYDLADTPSIADSPALNVTPAGKSDSFSVSDSPVLQPSLAPTDSVTPGDSGGLVINYVYTDVDDTTLGGHYFNQTPINPGGYE